MMLFMIATVIVYSCRLHYHRCQAGPELGDKIKWGKEIGNTFGGKYRSVLKEAKASEVGELFPEKPFLLNHEEKGDPLQRKQRE